MASSSKLFEAFKVILNDMNEAHIDDKSIDALKEENVELRLKKKELLSKLNRPSAVVTNSIVLVKDMLLRQKMLNEFQSETKDQSLAVLQDRSHETKSEENSWKERLDNVDDMVFWPYHTVAKRIQKMEDKICEDVSVIEELKKEFAELSESQHNETVDINLVETLSCAAEEQRQLIEKLEQHRIAKKSENDSPKQE